MESPVFSTNHSRYCGNMRWTISSDPFLLLSMLIIALWLTGPRASFAQSGPELSDSNEALASTTAPPIITTRFNNVFIVVGENESANAIIGNSAAPFMNSLAKQYASSASYYANTHPSIGNYFELTAGQTITNQDGYTGTVSADNIVRHLIAVRYTWKCYADSIPYAGYLGRNTGLYIKHHNPFSYLTDVVNNKAEAANMVPFTQLPADIKSGALPQYGFIVPNAVDDGHNCPASKPKCSANQRIADFDSWLQANLMPLISDRSFSASGLLVITFDEAHGDSRHGGGQVAWIAVAGVAKPGYVGTSPVDQHQNTLRLMGTSLGLTSLPGAANSGDNMSSYFN